MPVIRSHRSSLASAAVVLLAWFAFSGCGGRAPGPNPSPPPTDGGGGPAPGGGGGDPAPGGEPTPGGGGGGGGTPADACVGLAPTFAAAVELQFDTGTHRACSVATTSAAGQVALGVAGSFAGGAGTAFQLYSADGSAYEGLIDGLLQARPSVTQDVDSWFHPTSGGYQGIVHPGNANPLPFRTWDASGALVREIERFAVSSAPDRNGASLLLARAFDPSNPATPGPTQLEWVDASGQVTRSVTLDRDPQLVLSNWATGHVVIVVPGSPGSARWFDESGSALTPWFDIGDLSAAASLHLLLDGTVAINVGEQWQLALSDGAAAVGTVPGWLASRPSTRLATIRQGRAYAVLPLEGAASGATRFEIVAGSGQSCGSFFIPPADVRPGEAKTPQRLDVGQDGTLLQMSSLTGTPNQFGVHCTFRWWSKLLQ